LSELPDDLAELERELAARRAPEPLTGFRPHLLAAVAEELNRFEDGNNSRRFWRFAAVVAAALLLGINLSLSVVNDMDWHLTGGVDPERIAATATKLHELEPDLPEQEAYRQALVLQVAVRMPPLPDCRPSLPGLLQDHRQLHETR
jgi:hypothetical protein